VDDEPEVPAAGQRPKVKDIVWALCLAFTQFDAVVEAEEVDWDGYEALDRMFMADARKIMQAALKHGVEEARPSADAARIAELEGALRKIADPSRNYTSTTCIDMATEARAALTKPAAHGGK